MSDTVTPPAAGENRYGPSAARPPRPPGPPPRPTDRVIDIHSHIAVPEAAALAGPHLDPSQAPLFRFATPDSRALNRKQEGDRRAVSTQVEPRLAELDAMGIDLQAIKAPPGQCYYTLPLEVAVPATRMVNDGIAEFAARRPDRFLGLGGVPMQDAGEAVRELERCLGPLGFKGVQILTNVAGRELSDPDFAPFWEAAERLDALVVIHPAGFTDGARMQRFYGNNVLGNPLDTTLALYNLIMDGVLERHPRLKILAVHGGGFLPAYSGRMDHTWGARGDAHAGLPRPPSTYLRQVFLDTVVFTAHQLEYLVRVFGADRVMLGTDYPFDMAEYDPLGHLAAVDSFDDATRAAIAGGNAAKLLGL
ncbi:amidohydrolase family protein [Roseomonas sp. BN140053]|uniref:amidohydrolase family protein n=1 Tax=Roseomonas sp. BN140053 TaxID=3391898 RepID=UPI0039EA060C